MLRPPLAIAFVLLASLISTCATATELVSFNDSIRPLFNKHCTACHGGVQEAGDVSFSYRDRVLPPDGWIVEPGKPDESILIERILSDDPDIRMPPPEHSAGLNDREVALFKRWIEQGATWTEHWAYEKPTAPAKPSLKDEDWCRQPLDRFVLSRLESEGIEPADQEQPERWLRRVTLDLTGLPPSPEERASFLSRIKAQGDAAYESVVEDLLSRGSFGERWASVWLDQIRYADSKGLGLDSRRNIWKYRDWVISAINEDVPFDEFTVKQLAGDLLPDRTIDDLIATAAHRNTQTNEEGGTDDEEFRIMAVLDRVNTTWQTWQGVTFGCVQCHSHPYDPFRHDEYYQFAAFFNNTADCDLNEDWPIVQAPIDPRHTKRASDLDAKIRRINRELWSREFEFLSDNEHWQPLRDLRVASSNATKLAIDAKANHDEFHTVDTISKNLVITVEAPLPSSLDELTGIRLTAMPLDPEKAVDDSEWGFVLSHLSAQLIVPGADSPLPIVFTRVLCDEPEPFYDPQQSLNPKSKQGFAAYTRIHHPRTAAFLLESPLEIPPGATLKVKLDHRLFILASFSLVIKRGKLDVTGDLRFTERDDDNAQSEREKLAKLKRERSKIASTSVPVLRNRETHLQRPTHVFARGLFLNKDKEVSPGTPESLPPIPADQNVDRLAMSRWLVSPENPLTARVTVNRIWARLFGTGIVATEEDFGSSGEPPSHPKLLDDLATRFQSSMGWSRKTLIREIVLSSTYRQSSAIRDELYERDASNRLLARGPRHRLSAELVRDQALSISGLLSTQMFGKPVHPPLPSGVWRPFAGGDKWKTPKRDDPNRYRRSIYTYTKRSIPFPMFASFDAPSREFCAPRRLRSNTPLQALMTLNDETFIECAEAFAKRIMEAANTVDERLAAGFAMATSRNGSQSEIDDLRHLFDALSDFDEQQRYESIATVLLNLDEVLTK
ncbi:MAG: PSD1 and planctomycete cytochrome C domain-containing protein [Planctomycetota bacterium]